jgi:hypothetical protein
MKITVNQLRRIIKEEVSRVLKENPVQDQGPGMSLKAGDVVTTTQQLPAYNVGGYPLRDRRGRVTTLPGAKFEVMDAEWAVTYVRAADGKDDPRYVLVSDLCNAMEMEEMV